jgi:methylthioribose-1-phosphate isomerase
MDIEAVRWAESGQALEIIDQTRLPEAEIRLQLDSAEATAEAIGSLRVRGAPAIGIAAALAYAVEAARAAPAGKAALRERLPRVYDVLVSARPTGVNLRWALDRMRGVAEGMPDAGAEAIAERLRAEATCILEEDRAMCRRIGQFGLPLLPENARVLTHCNAGALATGGIGTALAPIYMAHEAGQGVQVFADETRPLLQGSRLTAWELHRAGIAVTLVADVVAADLMRRGMIDLVIVGADRVAANGDVANKVGTYALSVLAKHHGIPFYVALPTSTLDTRCATGAGIPIEERAADEVRRGFGTLTAPSDVPVYAPAFDVTPAANITALITDAGVLFPPFDRAIAGLAADTETEPA